MTIFNQALLAGQRDASDGQTADKSALCRGEADSRQKKKETSISLLWT